MYDKMNNKRMRDNGCRMNAYSYYLSKELHDPLVLPQVFVPLEQENVVASVLPLHRDLAGPLLGRDDLYTGGVHSHALSVSIAVIFLMFCRHFNLL